MAEAYEDIARREPNRVISIDATGSPEEVHRLVMAEVEPRLPA